MAYTATVPPNFAPLRRRWGLSRVSRTDFLILLIGVYVLVPMPIAGGVPFHIALLASIMGYLCLFARNTLSLERSDQLFLGLAVTLFIWEGIAALYHGGRNDALFVIGRGLWITHAIVFFLAFREIVLEKGMKGLVQTLATMLTIWVLSALIGVIFFPEWAIGRQLGLINFPFPRSTGVPNSDGKIGTFVIICTVFGVFYRHYGGAWTRFIFLAAPVLAILFLQSRSLFSAIVIATPFCFAYTMLESRRKLITVIKLIVSLLAVGFAIQNFNVITEQLVGEGVFQRNVESRVHHAELAVILLPQQPLFGLGAAGVVDEQGKQIHNSFINLGARAGIPAALMFLTAIMLPIYAFGSSFRGFLFSSAIAAGFIVEHMLYPGLINENIPLFFIVAKYAVRHGGVKPLP